MDRQRLGLSSGFRDLKATVAPAGKTNWRWHRFGVEWSSLLFVLLLILTVFVDRTPAMGEWSGEE